MTEQLLQFIWQFRYFNATDLQTTAGELLQIIHPGTHNTNQGPDFLGARIRCGDTLLAGNIEIHRRASEWQEHRHSADSNYNNVILHVVLEEDKQLGLNFPTIELRDRISNLLLARYSEIMRAQHFIPCEKYILKAGDLTFTSWKDRLLVERLQEKSALIQSLFEQNNHDWENTFWQTLARNFGMKINGDAFEKMAAALSVNMLAKHRHSIHQLEALLLGQAGLLSNSFTEDYPKMLRKEFAFLQKKYALPAVHVPVHFLRMRPANFPTIRLAQLAMLVHQSNHLFSKIKDAESCKSVMSMFDVTANDYWHYHYSFDEPSDFKEKVVGTQMAANIILNTVIPLLFAYAQNNKSISLKAKALQWAQELAAEQNNITRGFQLLGVENLSAADSQALIQLKNKYCDARRCLECAVGNMILKAE